MKRALSTGIAVGIAAAALLAPAAGAEVYCVHKAASTCADTGVLAQDAGTNVQAGLDAALAHPGPDTVLIGAGMFVGPSTSPSISYLTTNVANPVAIAGDPDGHTSLQAPAGSTSVVGLLGPSTVTLKNVVIDVANQTNAIGLYLDSSDPATIPTGPGASAVQVLGGVAANIGARLRNGASITDSRLEGGPTGGMGAQVDQGAATLTDVGIAGRAGVYTTGTGDLTARRLFVSDTAAGAVRASSGGKAVVDGLYVHDSTVALVSDNDAKLTVRQATLIGPGTGPAIDVESTSAGQASILTLTNSIVRGYVGGLCISSAGGSSTVNLGHDDVPAAGYPCSAPGTLNPGVGNVDVDPRFVNPDAGLFNSDYRLRYDSPLIDAGDPATCQTPCQSSELDGLSRPVDGNGDGSAIRDIGGYEYQRRAPVVIATASPASAAAGQAVTFDGSGTTDPDAGDTLASYAWTFDDGTTAAGPTVTHAFGSGGSHTATLTVTDGAGAAGTSAASVAVAPPPPPAPPAPPKPPLVTPPADRTKPTLTKLKLSHTTVDRHHRSTAISFTLSERSKLVVAFAKASRGITVGHSCVSPSKRHPHGHACLRYGPARSLTVAHQPTGAGHVTFAGKVGAVRLAAGTYRLTIVATDAAGNRSTAHHLALRIG